MTETIDKQEKSKLTVIRKRIIDLSRKINETYWELSELLYTVYSKGYFRDWKYKSFSEYVEKELDMSIRKAYYLVSVWDWFVVKGNVSNYDKVRKLDWTKARALVGVINKDNQDIWIKKAITTNVRDFSEEVKKYVKINREAISPNMPDLTNVDIVHRLVFTVFEDQYNNIMQALEVAKNISNSDKSGHNLDLICTEFLATHQVSGGFNIDNIRKFLKSFEDATGIKIVAIYKDEVIYGDKLLKV